MMRVELDGNGGNRSPLHAARELLHAVADDATALGRLRWRDGCARGQQEHEDWESELEHGMHSVVVTVRSAIGTTRLRQMRSCASLE